MVFGGADEDEGTKVDGLFERDIESPCRFWQLQSVEVPPASVDLLLVPHLAYRQKSVLESWHATHVGKGEGHQLALIVFGDDWHVANGGGFG